MKRLHVIQSHASASLQCRETLHYCRENPQNKHKSFLVGSIAPLGLVRHKRVNLWCSQGGGGRSKQKDWSFSLLLRLRRDPWDRHRAIMRASPWVTGQENREAFVRVMCEKKKKNAEPSRPSPLLLPSHPMLFFFSLPEDAHKCLYTHLSVFASGPKGARLSLQLVGG